MTTKSAEENENLKPEADDSEESDVELDFEGVIEPDMDPPQVMGSLDKEVTEDDIENSGKKQKEAMELYAQGKFQEAITSLTEAILLKPNSSHLYVKRGQCYLQLKKPNACVRDCTRALEINPDYAAGYKFRGRSHRLLGNFTDAAEDLRTACKIDFDEEANDWLKEVTPNARKIEEHQRKYQRRKAKRELTEIRDRIQKMMGEMKTGESDSDEKGEGSENDSEEIAELIHKMMRDGELMEILRDPDVRGALTDATKFPPKIFKYIENPKVNRLFKRMDRLFAGQSLHVIDKIYEEVKLLADKTIHSEDKPAKKMEEIELD